MDTPQEQSNSHPERVEGVQADDAEIKAFLGSLVSAITDITEQGRQRNAAEREIALRGFESSERTEQLQYELALTQMQSADEQHSRRYRLGRLIIIIVGVVLLGLLVLVGLVVAMAFFGSERQSQTALTMLGYGSAAIAGGGVVILIVYVINSLTRWWQGM